MSNLRQAAEQALEALENHTAIKHPQQIHYRDSAIEALRTALAEEALQRLTDVQQDIEAELAEPNKCTHGVTDSCKECYMVEPEQEPVFDCPRCGHCCPQTEQEPVAWTPVDKALPKSGVQVLACYRNRLGNLRRIRAQWIAAKTQEADSDDAEACSEYDEATDTYYTTEGWYECIDNWGDYSSVAVCEGDVTHWMPLPPDPYTAPPQRKPLSDEEIEVLAMDIDGTPKIYLEFARDIEWVHGIKGKL